MVVSPPENHIRAAADVATENYGLSGLLRMTSTEDLAWCATRSLTLPTAAKPCRRLLPRTSRSAVSLSARSASTGERIERGVRSMFPDRVELELVPVTAATTRRSALVSSASRLASERFNGAWGAVEGHDDGAWELLGIAAWTCDQHEQGASWST